jgi:hypothetical protein
MARTRPSSSSLLIGILAWPGIVQALIWVRQSEQVLYQVPPNSGVSTSRPFLQQAERKQNRRIGGFFHNSASCKLLKIN